MTEEMSKNKSLSIWATALAVVLFTTLFPAKMAAQGRTSDKDVVPLATQGETSPAGVREEIKGTVAKVDLAANKLTVQTDSKQEQTLAMDSRTEIKMDGKPATASDLKEGQQIAVVAEGVKVLSVVVLEQTASR